MFFVSIAFLFGLSFWVSILPVLQFSIFIFRHIFLILLFFICIDFYVFCHIPFYFCLVIFRFLCLSWVLFLRNFHLYFPSCFGLSFIFFLFSVVISAFLLFSFFVVGFYKFEWFVRQFSSLHLLSFSYLTFCHCVLCLSLLLFILHFSIFCHVLSALVILYYFVRHYFILPLFSFFWCHVLPCYFFIFCM